MAERIDARGLSCPQPVILMRKALENAGGGEVIVEVDTMTHVQNCSRAAEQLGWDVDHQKQGEVYELKLTKRVAIP